MKIICLIRQGLNLWCRNVKWDLLLAVSMSSSNKLVLKDWSYKTPITGILNLDENKLGYKKNYLWRKRCIEILKYEIDTRWEKWRELKNYELTNSQDIKRKSRANTKARFTIAGFARKMNSMKDSGEFQEEESNHRGRLSHVPNQLAMIPSSRSMLSRDKRLPFDTWILSEPQENVLGDQFSTLDSPRDHHQGLHYRTTPRETGSVPQTTGTETSFTSDEEQNGGTIPMPTFARRPSTMSSLFPVDFPQNYMVGQQRQQISELQFDKFLYPRSFFVWKIRFQTQVTSYSDFPSDAMLWITEVEMVDFFGRIKILAISLRKGFSKLRDPGRVDCLCSEQDHPEFPVQEESQLRGAESPKRGPVFTRKTDRLQDLRRLSSDWPSWYSIGFCWFVLCYSSQRQCLGIRYELGWIFNCRWPRCPRTIFWKAWTN